MNNKHTNSIKPQAVGKPVVGDNPAAPRRLVQRRVRLGRTEKRIRQTIDIWKSGCMETVTERRLDLKQFGEVMRYHRQDARLSLRELARRSGISAPHLSDCELGRRALSDSALMRWGRALYEA